MSDDYRPLRIFTKSGVLLNYKSDDRGSGLKVMTCAVDSKCDFENKNYENGHSTERCIELCSKSNVNAKEPNNNRELIYHGDSDYRPLKIIKKNGEIIEGVSRNKRSIIDSITFAIDSIDKFNRRNYKYKRSVERSVNLRSKSNIKAKEPNSNRDLIYYSDMNCRPLRIVKKNGEVIGGISKDEGSIVDSITYAIDSIDRFNNQNYRDLCDYSHKTSMDCN